MNFGNDATAICSHFVVMLKFGFDRFQKTVC